MSDWEWPNLGQMLGDLINQYMNNMFWPTWDFFTGIIIGFLNTCLTLLLLIVDIISLGASTISFVTSFLGLFMEDGLSGIITAQISLIVLLRAYYFIKGIRIAGFGI